MHFPVVEGKSWITVSEASGCRVSDQPQTSLLTSFRMDSAAGQREYVVYWEYQCVQPRE